MEWAEANEEELDKIDSDLRFNLLRVEFLELVKAGRLDDAFKMRSRLK
jgi:hypothetical protein